jgi:hypothetical protein
VHGLRADIGKRVQGCLFNELFLGIITGLADPRVWREGCRRGGCGFEISTHDQPSPAARVGFCPRGFFFHQWTTFFGPRIVRFVPPPPSTDPQNTAASRRLVPFLLSPCTLINKQSTNASRSIIFDQQAPFSDSPQSF